MRKNESRAPSLTETLDVEFASIELASGGISARRVDDASKKGGEKRKRKEKRVHVRARVCDDDLRR